MHPPKFFRFAVLAATCLTPVFTSPTRAADLFNDTFTGGKNAAISGRTPDTANANAGKWSVISINTGGGFNATIDPSIGNPAPAAHLTCGGNSTGAIAIPLSGNTTSAKPPRFTISADLRGADPGLGFYSALPPQDPPGVFDVFSNFTGLRLTGDGTLALFRKGGFVTGVKYTGTFDAKEFHKLSYEVDTRSGALAGVSLQGSTSDYSALSVPSAFTGPATTYAAVASLCENSRDNQTYADNFFIAPSAHPSVASPAPVPAKSTSAHASILVQSGEKIGFMGDSITEQGNSPKGYVQLVIAGLKEEGVAATAIPAGHSGHTSGNMVGRTHFDILHKGADWMTLSCGVNDVMLQAKGYGCDFPTFQKNVTAMVAQAQGWNVRVVLLTATPLGEEDAQSENNRKLATYNDFLRSLAREKKLALADVNAAFWAVLQTPLPKGATPGKRLLADGIHPNETGQFLMATTVLQALGVPPADLPRIEKAIRPAK